MPIEKHGNIDHAIRNRAYVRNVVLRLNLNDINGANREAAIEIEAGQNPIAPNVRNPDDINNRENNLLRPRR